MLPATESAPRSVQPENYKIFNMFPSIKPDQTEAWNKLKAHYQYAKTWHLKQMFKDDDLRF